jgi:Protein of unknown function (DUF2934)
MGGEFFGIAAAAQRSHMRDEYRLSSESPVPPSQLADQAMRADIAELAYLLWEENGCPSGSAQSDWLEAERTIQARIYLGSPIQL